MDINLVLAVDRNGTIGHRGGLPWPRISADMRRFRGLTMLHPVIMGRKTYEGLPSYLDGRDAIVLTRDPGSYRVPWSGDWPARSRRGGWHVAGNLAEAIHHASRTRVCEAAFIIGGAAVFVEALPLADRVYLTRIDAEFEGDAAFPLDLILEPPWRDVAGERCPKGEGSPFDLEFLTLERK